MTRSVFSLAIPFASLLFFLSAAAAFAGEDEVRAALVLIEDNQERLRDLGFKHRTTIGDARADMLKQPHNVQYEPGAYEAFFFAAEGGQMTQRAVGQLEVLRQILATEAANKDPKVAAAVAVLEKLADCQEAYLLKAVESAVYDMSFERMYAEIQALDEAYEKQLDEVPFWATTLVGKAGRLEAYAGRIRAAAAKVQLTLIPGKEGPTLVRLPSGAIGNAERAGRQPSPAAISKDEYQAKKKAYEARLAEQERQREQRLAELRRSSPGPAPSPSPKPSPAVAAKTAPSAPAKPAPTAKPPDHSTVAAWHASFYQVRIVPFKKALGEVLGIQDRSRRSAQLVESCTRLSAASVALLGEQRLPSRTPAVDLPLRAVLETYDRAAQACVVGKMADLASGLASGEAALGRFAAGLAPYGLTP